MKTFDDLIDLLEKVGFNKSNKVLLGSGSYEIYDKNKSVLVMLDHYISITKEPSDLVISFYYKSEGRSKLLKTIRMEYTDLESFLLTSIIQGSFLSDEEKNKASQELLTWWISWSQTSN